MHVLLHFEDEPVMRNSGSIGAAIHQSAQKHRVLRTGAAFHQ